MGVPHIAGPFTAEKVIQNGWRNGPPPMLGTLHIKKDKTPPNRYNSVSNHQKL